MEKNNKFQELSPSKIPFKRSKSTDHLELHSTEILEKTIKHNQDFLSPRQMINKIQLSPNAKIMLALRILLISLFCIYIPIETLFHDKLEKIENHLIGDYLTALIPSSIRKEQWYSLLTTSIIKLIADKESIIIIISIIYILFPFIAVKLVFVINSIYYIIVILQCMYSSRRPFWNETSSEEIVNPFCMTSYANPSTHFFFISFVYLYFTVSLSMVHKKEKFSFLSKAIIFISYFIIVGGIGFMLLVNKVNFFYQLSLSLSISLITISGLADLDDLIHNFIYKSLKNIFQARQYKMKILFYVFALMLFSLITCYFVPEDNLNIIKDRLLFNQYCNKQSLDEIGIKNTFINITYIFGIIGAFWGASFAIEKDRGKWWEGSVKYLILKILMVLLFGSGYNYLIIYTELLFYELRFFVLCLTNFLHYYIVMGLFPALFDFFNLNDKNIKNSRKQVKDIKESQLLGMTLVDDVNQNQKPLVDEYGFIQGKFNLTNSILNSKEINAVKDMSLSYENNSNNITIPEEDKSNINNDETMNNENKIYKKSPLIKGLEKHSNDEQFEFTVKDEGAPEFNQLYLHFISHKINEEAEDNSPKSQQ